MFEKTSSGTAAAAAEEALVEGCNEHTATHIIWLAQPHLSYHKTAAIDSRGQARQKSVEECVWGGGA